MTERVCHAPCKAVSWHVTSKRSSTASPNAVFVLKNYLVKLHTLLSPISGSARVKCVHITILMRGLRAKLSPSWCWVLSLELTAVNDGGLLVVLDGTGAGASGLKSLDNAHRLVVGDLAENDVAAVQPGSLDGGHEELGAVAAKESVLALLFSSNNPVANMSLRVGASVGHGEETGTSVLDVEVLVGELLAVDGLATGAVTTGEITTLKHELGDDAVESRALVAEALLAGAESAEVLSGLGDDVIVELEVDAAGLLCVVYQLSVRLVMLLQTCGVAAQLL